MALELKLQKTNDSLGVVLPKDLLARLNLKEGYALYLLENASDGFLVAKKDSILARKMEVANDLSARYQNALKELAQ